MKRIWSVLDFLSKKRRGKGAKVQDERIHFVHYYDAFRALLDANHSILVTMADMQEKAGGAFVFDKGYLRNSCHILIENILIMIGKLNRLSDNLYEKLNIPAQRCVAAIREILEPAVSIPDAAGVIPLSQLSRADIGSAGGKMANLGVLANQMGLAVPPGFAITTRAYSDFMRYNEMALFIQRELERVNIQKYNDLQHVSNIIQRKILDAQLPPDLEASIIDRYQRLCQSTGNDRLKVAIRSSAMKEDVQTSFAGQYKSILNVPANRIVAGYKRIVASQFAPQGIFYYKEKEFQLEQMVMAVGLQAMVEASIAGVAYSRDPSQPEAGRVLINAVRGLGPYAVDGSVRPDVYSVATEPELEITVLQTNRQEMMLSPHQESGTLQQAVPPEQIGKPCLSDATIMQIAASARTIEEHYGQPQDIEWAVDHSGRLFFLQSRPLRLSPAGMPSADKWPTDIEGHRKLLDTGTVVCRGVAAGPVNRVLDESDLADFPPGGVLVVRHGDPEYAILLKKAAAVVAEIGSPLSHLATVVREYNTPAIFNATGALDHLRNGTVVTVDAVLANIYEDRVEALLARRSSQGSFKSTQIVRQLDDILKHVTPLHLTDPRSSSFRPAACRTLHDITRFCHEAALQSMFKLSRERQFAKHSAKKLVAEVPLQWWVIDLKDGINEFQGKKNISIANIESIPFKALWEGMTALPWKGPPPVDTKGFIDTILRASRDPSIDPAVGRKFVDRNYILIAKNYCNVSTRLGFHFSTLESYIGDHDNQNYVSFVFTGGGADDARRNRRAQLIARLMAYFGFRVEVKGNALFARIEDYPANMIQNRLKILGHIIIHTRQLDMAMYNDRMIDWYLKENISAIQSFVNTAGDSV